MNSVYSVLDCSRRAHCSASQRRSCTWGRFVRYPSSDLSLQFHFIEANDLNIWAEPAKAMSPSGLFEGIIETFENIPKESKIDYDDYGVVNVSPSVVPNPYLPSFRIFSYNITDAGSQMMRPSDSKLRVHTTKDRTPRHRSGRAGDKKKLCKLKEYRDTWKCQLREAWHSDEEAPSRQNKLWSPLGYAQVRR